MADATPPRHRPPFGIFEAAILLVLVAIAVSLARPIPGARAAAEAEKGMLAILGTVADAEDGLPAKGPFLPLAALSARSPAAAEALRGMVPSGVEGVLGNDSYWLTVLLPDHDGVVRDAAGGDAAGALRGYVVLAWPRRRASPLLRSLAALPAGRRWQRADHMEESGEPGEPPVPRTAFSARAGTIRVQEPPPDWVRSRDRRKPEGGK